MRLLYQDHLDIISMQRNQQHGSKSTNYSLETRPQLNLLKKERSVRALAEAKNVKVSHVFDLRSHVYCKARNGSEEIAGK